MLSGPLTWQSWHLVSPGSWSDTVLYLTTLYCTVLYCAGVARFREGYGMTEMSPAVTFTDLDTSQTGGSCGKLLPNTRMKVTTI